AAVLGLEDGVAVAAQDGPDQDADGLVVLDQQDGLAAAAGRAGDDGNLGGLEVPLGARQVDLEGGAATDLAVDPDRAAALLDDREHHREAEASALVGALGREERLEDPAARRLVHAHAGVAEREHHVVPGLDVEMAGGESVVELDVSGLDGELAT